MNVWTLLDIRATSDEREIKRAYARRLKATRPEDDPAAFQALSDAYQMALRMAQHARAQEADEQEADEQEQATQSNEAPPQSAWEGPEAQSPGGEALEAWERPLPALKEEAWERPVPFLRELPDPAALARQRRREREEALAQAREQARAASEAAFEQARRLWAHFLDTVSGAPTWQLKEVLDSREMLNLEVREHFELFAVQHCAGDACPDELRASIATVFHWEDDASFIERRLPEAAHEALARLRAGRSYEQYRARAGSEPAVAALLADSAGRRFGRTLRRNFTRALQTEIALIRSFHQEMLHFKLNRDVFEEWERRVDGRRYFLETALSSAGAGLGLNLLAALTLDYWGVALDRGVRIALCVALAMAIGAAWIRYRPLERFSGTDWATHLLHDLRHRPMVQYGWIGAYALLSVLMFIPAPPAPLVWLIGIGMVGCALAASFASSLLLERVHFISAGFAALIVGGGLAGKAFAPYGYVACIAGAFCAMQLLLRGGAHLWGELRAHADRLFPLRCAWLVGLLALALGADFSPLPAQLHTALTWLWVLAGMLLSLPTANFVAVFGGAALLAGATGALLPEQSVHKALQLGYVVFSAYIVAIFMLVNMSRTTKNQHSFS